MWDYVLNYETCSLLFGIFFWPRFVVKMWSSMKIDSVRQHLRSVMESHVQLQQHLRSVMESHSELQQRSEVMQNKRDTHVEQKYQASFAGMEQRNKALQQRLDEAKQKHQASHCTTGERQRADETEARRDGAEISVFTCPIGTAQ